MNLNGPLGLDPFDFRDRNKATTGNDDRCDPPFADGAAYRFGVPTPAIADLVGRKEFGAVRLARTSLFGGSATRRCCFYHIDTIRSSVAPCHTVQQFADGGNMKQLNVDYKTARVTIRGGER